MLRRTANSMSVSQVKAIFTSPESVIYSKCLRAAQSWGAAGVAAQAVSKHVNTYIRMQRANLVSLDESRLTALTEATCRPGETWDSECSPLVSNYRRGMYRKPLAGRLPDLFVGAPLHGSAPSLWIQRIGRGFCTGLSTVLAQGRRSQHSRECRTWRRKRGSSQNTS